MTKRKPKQSVQIEIPRLDEIGPWSLVKLDIIREYAGPYSLILKRKNFKSIYIDAFSGAGLHVTRETNEHVLGSPLQVLSVEPSFDKYYFIDIDASKAGFLQRLVGTRSDVIVREGDCNELLRSEVFPEIKWKNYQRALCLLDPKGLHLNWDVIQQAGESRSIELFLNFPLMDMNMNALWRRNPDGADPRQVERMNRYWGDESWRKVVYNRTSDLFGHPEKLPNANQAIARAFQDRLKSVARFKYVPSPIVMRNSTGAELYYLFFASPNETGQKIVKGIFNKYRRFESR